MPTQPYTEAWLAGPGDYQFYTRTYAAEQPHAILLFVHGFCEHVGRYEGVFPWFAERGITVFAFDGRGFGRTALDKDHKSRDAAYGKTSWREQLGDVEFWVKHLVKENPGVPVFLMGHSMGGGVACAFSTRVNAPPSPETVKLLSGVILSSPLILLTHPKPKILLLAGGQLGRLFPSMSVPAGVDPDALSRNPPRNEAYMNDPLIKQVGTLKGVDDMLSGGMKLAESDWERWPKNLPALFVHGTGDQVTSHKATEEFFGKMPAEDKNLTLYPGAYHEMFQEIEDIPRKLADEIISWIDARTSHNAPEAKL